MLGQREAQNVGEAQMADTDPRQRVQGTQAGREWSWEDSQAVDRRAERGSSQIKDKVCWKALGDITKEDGEKAYGTGKSGKITITVSTGILSAFQRWGCFLQYLSKTFSLDYSICHMNMYLLAPKKNVLDKEFECPFVYQWPLRTVIKPSPLI